MEHYVQLEGIGKEIVVTVVGCICVKMAIVEEELNQYYSVPSGTIPPYH